MNYNVFISYSRKDASTVDKICKVLDQHQITYFIDRSGISGGLEFPEIIVNAIENSDIFLFIGSKNSYASKYVSNEITYAYNVRPHNTIIPYMIDSTPLPQVLQFIFGNVNYRNIKEHPIQKVLINDIKTMLKKVNPEMSNVKETEIRKADSRSLLKERHPLLLAGVGVQVVLYTALLFFFGQLFFFGYIQQGSHGIGWWTNVLLSVSFIASIFSTLMLLFKRKKLFYYALCGLDVVQALSISCIGSVVAMRGSSYVTNTYSAISSFGHLLLANRLWMSLLIILMIAIHSYVMYTILKLKHNGVSAWEKMK